jgi:NAD(P)-dependent dehydrogenase (short-subunit alcohol dehydrogenase family)
VLGAGGTVTLATGTGTVLGGCDVSAQAARLTVASKTAGRAEVAERRMGNTRIQRTEAEMRDLKGKVAVVTGAASGIGLAMAERFAREGMKLVLADVDEKALAAARDAIAASGADAVAAPTDVSQAEQVEALASKAFEAFGGAHVVCNNAGVGCGGLTWEASRADWEWVLGVNLWGVVHGVRAFVPRMIAQGEGHVVNTASIAGLLSAPGMGPYCASKHAVVALSECLHHDLVLGAGGKVKVSVLCPAWVKTRIADAARNRPPSPAKASGRSPQAQMVEGRIRAAVEGGIAPAEVAEQVLSAVVEERFWILTHPKSKKAVERRMNGILDDKLPDFDPSRM